MGGGLYAPERARLAQVREAIADDRRGPELERIVAEDHSAITGLPLIALVTILRGLGYAVP